MSFSGSSSRRRRSGVCVSMVVWLIVLFSVLQIWVLSSDCCRARAIRILATSSSSSSNKDSSDDEIKRSELYRKFFNGRFGHLNSTGASKGFQENKRRVPSCPDPLHN